MEVLSRLVRFLLIIIGGVTIAFSNTYGSEKVSSTSKEKQSAGTFYIDSKNGDDNNSGSSPKRAWQSLAKVNSVLLFPGSKILFKSGGFWTGQLSPKGSGTEGKPIVIDKYGKGPKPVFNGNGIIAAGVIKLHNQSYWEIRNLEIINTASFDAERRGVETSASNYGLIKHIYLQNLSIHHIRGTVGNELSDKKSAGIYFTVTDDREKVTRYDDILVEGCEIHHCQNQGIVINNEVSVADYPGSEAWEKRKITNLVVRNNIIHHISKNAMIIRLADKGLVERNICYETALRTTGNTIFSRSAQNTIFQYNEGYLNRSPDYDGSMYDPDFNSPGTIWQYSYSHDNAHGLVWFCTDPKDTGVIVRYNMSYNDKGNLVYINYGFKEAKIYNNTFYIGEGLNPKVIVENPKNDHTYSYQNNMVFNAGAENIKLELATAGKGVQNRTINNNIFYRINTPPQINLSTNLTSNPLLSIPEDTYSTNNKVIAYQLAQGSPALNSGVHVFKDTLKFSQKPNIGLYSGRAVVGARHISTPKRPVLGNTKFNLHIKLKGIDKREIDRETLRYRSIIYSKYDQNSNAALAEQKLRDTVLLTLKKLKVQEHLLAQNGLWPYSSYQDLLANMKAINKNRKVSHKNKEVIFGPVTFTDRSFYDYQFSNAITVLKKLMTAKEIPLNNSLLEEHFKKQKLTVYAAEKYTFENMKRQVEEAYVEEQYALLIDKALSDLDLAK